MLLLKILKRFSKKLITVEICFLYVFDISVYNDIRLILIPAVGWILASDLNGKSICNRGSSIPKHIGKFVYGFILYKNGVTNHKISGVKLSNSALAHILE